jgi:hypothetical protein
VATAVAALVYGTILSLTAPAVPNEKPRPAGVSNCGTGVEKRGLGLRGKDGALLSARIAPVAEIRTVTTLRSSGKTF